MRRVGRRIRAELRYWRAVLAQTAYIVRPFDMLADRRRWFWQRSSPCGFSAGGRIEPFNKGRTSTVMLSPGTGVVSRAQVDAVGVDVLRRINGVETDLIIVEPDRTLTEVPHDEPEAT